METVSESRRTVFERSRNSAQAYEKYTLFSRTHYSAVQHVESETDENIATRASRSSTAKYSVMNFHFIDKLLCDLN
jgi:hypothetical protein